MTIGPLDEILKKFKTGKNITRSWKSILNLAKLQSLAMRCSKIWKIYPCKFGKFCIHLYYRWKIIPSWTLGYSFLTDNTKLQKIWQLCKAIFFIVYNISQPNFAMLLSLGRLLMYKKIFQWTILQISWNFILATQVCMLTCQNVCDCERSLKTRGNWDLVFWLCKCNDWK